MITLNDKRMMAMISIWLNGIFLGMALWVQDVPSCVVCVVGTVVCAIINIMYFEKDKP